MVSSAPTEFTTQLYIDGKWSDAQRNLVDINPATGQQITEFGAADAGDVHSAVQAARTAFDNHWSRSKPSVRVDLLNRIADLCTRDAGVLAGLEALDIGKPLAQAAGLDVPMAIATFRHFAGWADKITGKTIPTDGYFGADTLSYTVRHPIGVLGIIVPWNSPLMIAAWKIAPALAAGNTIVVKPPEDAPLSLLHLARLIDEAGVPPGVVNVVAGRGDIAGAALVAHPEVDKISFTGSTAVGTTIHREVSGSMKRLTLELGGKSPQIVLPDADLDRALAGLSLGLFANQGQVCAAGSRILAHRSVYAEVVDGLEAAGRAQILGDPFDDATTMGPLINERQRKSVLRHVSGAVTEGARLVVGGTTPTLPGYYVEPTIIADAVNTMAIAREEVFGPVGCVIAFDTEEEAIAIANDTEYGLAATIWTQNLSTAHRVADGVRAGSVAVNGWSPLDPALPWGGVKASGIGRELGLAGLHACTEEKVVTVVL
ncbi:aldehyde dehydrogenase family protein [Nocardia pseudovaccinii]|uniref:aldehyde dehydrogenase family protein n=1 Tax=Nocardia pseudovaccinii TaxID=189540 RepID=UPI003D8CFBB7